MSTGLRIALVGGLAVVVGFVLWTVSQSPDNAKEQLPFDRSVNDTSDQTRFAQDVEASFSNPPASAQQPSVARIKPRKTSPPPKPRTTTPDNRPKPVAQPPTARRTLPPAVIPPARENRPAAVQTTPPARRPIPEAQPTNPDKPGDMPADTKPVEIGPPVAKIVDKPPVAKPEPKPLERPARQQPAPKPATPTATPARNSKPVPAPAKQPGQTVHTIAPGDTLIFIAGQYYFDENLWPAIKLANPDIDENRLKIGQKLVIPSEAQAKRMLGKTSSARPVARAESKQTATGGERIYVVEDGDSLAKIARNVLGDARRWKEIYELNKDKLKSPDHIEVGMKLKMPPRK